jgi:hypothetical protein
MGLEISGPITADKCASGTIKLGRWVVSTAHCTLLQSRVYASNDTSSFLSTRFLMGNVGLGCVNCSQSAEVMSDNNNQEVLDEFTKKNLLLRIEKSHIPRTEVVLLDVCDNDVTSFGKVGSNERRQVQHFWNNIRRQSIRTYVIRLKQYGIAIGDGTRLELEQQGRAPSPSTPEDTTAEETAQDEETSATEAGRNKEDNINILLTPLAKAVQDLSLSSRGRFSSCRSPPTSTSRRTLHFETMASSEEPSFGSNEPSSSGAKVYPQGSRGNPYVIKVDIHYPESNREFEVTFVPRIIHAGWSREGFCIRKELGISEESYWSASMYREPPYHFTNRAILIQGLKRSLAYEDFDQFNRRDNHCVSLKEMMINTSEALTGNDERKLAFYLLVFPEDIELDNVVLSGDAKEIEKNKVGNKYTFEEIDTAVMFVYWMIATRNSGHRIKQNKAASTSSAFD